MKNKISSQQASTLLKTAAQTIRGLSGENRNLREKVASMEKQDRIEKIAKSMEEKGLRGELTFEEKVAHLNKAPDLNVIDEAIKMAAAQSVGIGRVSDEPGSGGGKHVFETFIETGDAPE